METRPLLVMVGPTASGKTSLAIDIAKECNGEVICADSRTVYRGMDIGTAKPTQQEMQGIPHWGLDLVDPNQKFTVADFKKYAVEKIAEIRGRGRMPILVGGTGLYIDSVLFDYEFGDKSDAKLRSKLQDMTLEELHVYCTENNVKLPENYKNKRYVIRAIEQKSINTKRRGEPIENSYVVGIAIDKPELKKRIEQRSEQIFKSGVVEEAERLGKIYGWDSESMTGNIYPLCKSYLEGAITEIEMIERFKVLDWRLAKRQLTWFKRNEHIHWLKRNQIKQCITDVLATEH